MEKITIPKKKGEKDSHSNNQETLKQQRQRRLPSCKAAIQQSYPRHDKPYRECAADDIDIVVFASRVLHVHVNFGGIAAFGS